MSTTADRHPAPAGGLAGVPGPEPATDPRTPAAGTGGVPAVGGPSGVPAAGGPAAGQPVVRVGRQAIFDRDRHLHGYELLFRADGRDPVHLPTVAERDVATSQVLTAALGDFGASAIGDDLPVFINLTRAFVTGELPLVVAPERVVLELTEDVEVDDEVLAGLHRLKAAGYPIAIDDFAGEPWRMAAMPLADYVKLVLTVDGGRADLEAMLALARSAAPRARIVVERIEDDDDFAFCRALGVDYFQGYGLQRPQVLTTAAMDASQTTALRLVTALADPDVSAAQIERLVTSDAALSMKVLRAASSSVAAPTEPISSVRQAIVMLGPRALASWTTLIVLSTGFATFQRQSALTFVLARAGACSRLASEDPHVAYTVGLLSGMADALGVPAMDLVGEVNLATAVKNALADYTGPAGEALAAVLLTESEAGPGGADRYAPPLPEADAQRERAALAYLAALGEAMSLSSQLRP